MPEAIAELRRQEAVANGAVAVESECFHGEIKANLIGCSMDEGCKRTIRIGASILVSRKFAQLGPQSSPALEAAIADAVAVAEKILQRIGHRSAGPPDQTMTSNANYLWKTRP